MTSIRLSDDARSILRRRLSGERVHVCDETRPAYRELAAAGLMIAGHSFRDGRDSVFKFTEAGWALAQDHSRRTPASGAPRLNPSTA